MLEEWSLKIIGITGGIGSGKSTVSRILEDLGAEIIDADKIAREVVSSKGDAFKEIIDTFGIELLNEKGELDRKKLADVVFNQPEKLDILNKISHKYVIDRILHSLDAKTKEEKGGTIVVDAPIPVKHGFLDTVDEVWVVYADRDIRIKRVMERGNMTYEEILNRINSQISDSDYLNIAHEVIENNGSIEELEKNVVKLFFQKKPG